jgi:mannose-1-phosphate guanylyltransferase
VSPSAIHDKPEVHVVILAGGRGTRFWPRSRMRTPKQLLNIVGRKTMLEQTIERIAPLVPASRVWVVTNAEQVAAVRRQLPQVAARHILAEPVGRNTAAAIALAAAHIQREIAAPEKPGKPDKLDKPSKPNKPGKPEPAADAVMAILPADHFIAQSARYRKIVRAALEVAARPGALVVLGVPPTRPETGYGYIEYERRGTRVAGEPVYNVRRFTEKPSLQKARRYVASRRYLWNAGMFFWRVSTLQEIMAKYLPKTHHAVLRLAETIGTHRYRDALRRIYPQLENISVDYAVLEPASHHPQTVFVLPAAVGWSDIGSWHSVYELLAKSPGANVSAAPFVALDASGNLLWSPGKFVGALGVRNLVLVDTPDALLLCSRDRAQDVGKIVKWLEAHHGRTLL